MALKTFTNFAIGDLVEMITAPGRFRPYLNRSGRVMRTKPERIGLFLNVRFAELPEGVDQLLEDAPAGYFRKTTPINTRRPALYLHEPEDTRTEFERQAEGKTWLENHGYTVLEIGQARKGVSCPKCSEWFRPTGWVGNTPGCPDTTVFRDDYPDGCALQMEWKDGPNAPRSDEQKAFEARKRIVVVWNLPTCLTAVWRFECSILPDQKRNTEIRDWLTERGLLISEEEGGTL